LFRIAWVDSDRLVDLAAPNVRKVDWPTCKAKLFEYDKVLHLRGRERGCFGFLKAKLGLRMQVSVNTLLPCGDFSQTGETSLIEDI